MEFKLPDIGEGVHEGEIVRWLVKEGDQLGIDQPMVEIMTDKATVEIPSPIAGKIQKLLVKEGDVVKVGQTILALEAGGAASTSAPAPAKAPAPPAQRPAAPAAAAPRPAASAPMAARPAAQGVLSPRPAAPAPAPRAPAHAAAPAHDTSFVASPGNVLATPATRRLARDLGVDLTQVPASGPSGRVTKEDLQRFAGASAAGPAMPAGQQARGPAPMPTPARPPRTAPTERETLVPFRGMRRKIAEAMTRSKTIIPEFVYVDEVDVTELVAFRKEAKGLAEKQGVKLTYLPFIVKAIIKGLKEYPTMNAELDEAGGNVVIKNYYNIGIAVDTEQGLIVPKVKDADRKSILEIAHEIQVLAEKARAGKLALDELQGGTITITNPGPIGGLFTAPVINWPEVAIVGVHKIVRKPVVKNDQITIADTMYLSLSVDHRVVDGATAARFCNVVMEYLASPKKLMLDMA